jgi:membrane-bound lytic murein transglycosylase D
LLYVIINQLKNSRIRAGHYLLIPTAKEDSKFYTLSQDVRKFNDLKKSFDGRRNMYSVKRGDNLWDISRKYGVKLSQLRQWNDISQKNLLKPGQKLIVWVKQHKNKRSLIKDTAKNTSSDAYIVKQGDSLWLIARKHDIHVTDLLKWNKIKKEKKLQPGQSLIVHQTITDA